MSIWFRRFFIVLLLSAGTSAFVWQTTRGSADPRSEEAARRKSRQTYSFPFEKDGLSLPGNTVVAGNDFLEPEAFPDKASAHRSHARPLQYRRRPTMNPKAVWI